MTADLTALENASEPKRCLKCGRVLMGLEEVPLCDPCEIERLRYDLKSAQADVTALRMVLEVADALYRCETRRGTLAFDQAELVSAKSVYYKARMGVKMDADSVKKEQQ